MKKNKPKPETDIFGYKWATVNVNGKVVRIKIKHKSEWQKEIEKAMSGKMTW